MIELKEISADKYKLFINDEVLENVRVSRSEVYSLTPEGFKETNAEHFSLYADDSIAFDTLINLPPKEFSKEVDFRFNNLFSWQEFNENSFQINFYLEGFTIQFEFRADLKVWDFAFSFLDFQDAFYSVWSNKDNFFGELKFDEYRASFRIDFVSKDFNSSIKEQIKPCLELLTDCYNETTQKIAVENSRNSIVLPFNFPETLKVSCKQYLQYFAQFLQDLGINVTSDLKEKAGRVLFSVTPTDDIEALYKIREALAIYLNLPSSPIVYDDSFAAMRLKQQIDSLKHSQQMAETEFRLRMAQSLVEAQNKTIEDQSGMIVQQATFIQQQKEHIEKITNPAVMIKSAENKEELEELYEGVKVGESETLKKWLGISLNPAKAIKTVVKNTFGKEDENKSVLGLDERSESGK